MPQFGRPSADTYNGDGWTEDDDVNINIFDQIDEVSASDADYIKSVTTPTTDAYVTKLSNVTDPVSSLGHVTRYRYGKDVASGDQIDIVVQLRQGYVNEGSQGTLIHSETHTNVGVFPIAGSFTLSGAEADSISNYSSLYLRFTANKP